jgi:hypothetical protein
MGNHNTEVEVVKAGGLQMTDPEGRVDQYLLGEDEIRGLRDDLNELLGEVSEKGRATTVVVEAVRKWIDAYDSPAYFDSFNMKAAVARGELLNAFREYERVTR